MKRNDFTSFDEFENSNTSGNMETVTVIKENEWFKVDLMTECKSYKTALNRFFNMLSDIPLLMEWKNEMIESCENGYFKCNDMMMSDGTYNTEPCFAWEVEQLDDNLFYIFLNRKIF